MEIEEAIKEIVCVSERYCNTIEKVISTRFESYTLTIKIMSIVIVCLSIAFIGLILVLNKNIEQIEVMSDILAGIPK